MSLRLILYFLTLFCLPSNVFSQTMAFVDVDQILSKMPEYTSTVSEVETQISTYKGVIDSFQQAIDAKHKKLEVERFLLSENAILAREKEISELEREKIRMTNTYFGADGFLVESRKKLVQPYLDKVLRVVQDYAVERGIDIILDKKKQNNIIFASPVLDKTKDILGILGIKE